MKYLIDTHILLWIILSPERLSRRVTDFLEINGGNVFVSDVSIWEVSLKFSINKLNLDRIRPDQIPQYVEESGIQIFHLSTKDVSNFYKLPLISHKNPLDRMLVWQSIQNGMSLISKDTRLHEYSEYGLNLVY